MRGGRGIAGGEHKILKAAQDEASPAALRRKTQEAQDLLIRIKSCQGFSLSGGATVHLGKAKF